MFTNRLIFVNISNTHPVVLLFAVIFNVPRVICLIPNTDVPRKREKLCFV